MFEPAPSGGIGSRSPDGQVHWNNAPGSSLAPGTDIGYSSYQAPPTGYRLMFNYRVDGGSFTGWQLMGTPPTTPFIMINGFSSGHGIDVQLKFQRISDSFDHPFLSPLYPWTWA